MDLNFGRGFQSMNESRVEIFCRGPPAVSSVAATNNNFVVRLSCRVLQIIARSLLLALLIAAFPWIDSMLRYQDNSNGVVRSPQIVDDSFFLPMLFKDLSKRGLIKPGFHMVYVGQATQQRLHMLQEKEIDVISERDFERQRSIPAETFNFVLADSFVAGEFIDRSLKIGGIVAVQMSGDPSDTFLVPPNFKIVYLQRFEATVVAMRKMGSAADDLLLHSEAKRRLLAVPSNIRKAALENLEDVLLEPPHPDRMHSKLHLRKTKYLPDLTGDSLDGYPRRVFIDVGLPGKDSSTAWFERHYPTRNLDFEHYKVEMVSEGQAAPAVGISEWLSMTVKEDEYVVMKAEAEVVEEMVKSKVIYLVDELFLECKNLGQDGKKNKEKSRKAYWECLALYGKLKDNGVAVHQWWG